MKTHSGVLKASLSVISVMLLITGCPMPTFTKLEDNQYSIVDLPDFPLMGDVLMSGTGTEFENRRQNLIQRARKYCRKYGKVAAIESIKAVPPLHEGDSGIEVIFSCLKDLSIN